MPCRARPGSPLEDAQAGCYDTCRALLMRLSQWLLAPCPPHSLVRSFAVMAAVQPTREGVRLVSHAACVSAVFLA